MNIGDLVWAVFLVASAVLLGQRPSPRPYLAGLACSVLAFGALWLTQTPSGRQLIGLADEPFFGMPPWLTVVMLVTWLLLPVGWLLVIRSVTSWEAAPWIFAVTWLPPGLFFGLSGGASNRSLVEDLLLWLPYWPLVLAGLGGAFGRPFG